MRVWIGTAGYSYPAWAGGFYPPGLKPARRLAYYARSFPLVEFNSSFYRCPTPEQVQRLVAQTPPGFGFVLKVPRSVSHDRLPDELPPFRTAAEAMRRAGRLLGTLCQFPESTRRDRGAREWVERIAGVLNGLDVAVEFRHRSWAGPDVTAWLAELGVDPVSVDVPDLPQLYPRGLVRAGRRLYVRLHSRVAENWYAGDGLRYDYHYSDSALLGWVEALKRNADAERALVLFNNCYSTQAISNGRRMRELLARNSPELEVVAPPGPPPLRQGTLFEE
jgi:uncharacterized protein YecE (DUF72 family)